MVTRAQPSSQGMLAGWTLRRPPGSGRVPRIAPRRPPTPPDMRFSHPAPVSISLLSARSDPTRSVCPASCPSVRFRYFHRAQSNCLTNPTVEPSLIRFGQELNQQFLEGAGERPGPRCGELDAVTKETIYLATSVSNQCAYCIASHTAAARKAGMTDAMLAELMAVVGMANETNRLPSGYQVEIDDRFKTG
jgi:AhpD family alkylhydroperoxidase